MVDMGVMLASGEGCQQSYSTAADWYRKAASQGNANAKVNLGNLLSEGKGVSQVNHEQANALFQEAIDGGNIDALFAMGVSYRHGNGVEQSHSMALSYWQRAADQRHAAAATNVGNAYWQGEGGYAKNWTLAKKYTKIGTAQGNATAIANWKLMTACAQCGTDNAQGGVCAGCRHVHYCNRACQWLHWRDPLDPHKEQCGGIPAQNSRRSAEHAWLAEHTPPQ